MNTKVKEEKLTDEALRDIVESKKEIKKGQKIEEVAKELDIKL